MLHLSIDRLAALADEQPTAAENDHLATCAQCAREVEAHRTLLAIAGGERESMGLPLTRWETLSERLKEEGLVGKSKWAEFTRPKFMLQAAAALLLVAGGAALGRVSAGASAMPIGAEGTQVAKGGAPNPDSLPTAFASVMEANQWKAAYANAYQNAVAYLAANDTASQPSGTPAVMKARLSALDRVSRTVQEALSDAPTDPVINDFYLNSFAQREATLRQLNAVLPQGVRMKSY
jgi:hypothetical protein